MTEFKKVLVAQAPLLGLLVLAAVLAHGGAVWPHEPLLWLPLAGHFLANHLFTLQFRKGAFDDLRQQPKLLGRIAVARLAVLALGVGLVASVLGARLIFRGSLGDAAFFYWAQRIAALSYAVIGIVALGGVLGRYRYPLYLLVLTSVLLLNWDGPSGLNFIDSLNLEILASPGRSWILGTVGLILAGVVGRARVKTGTLHFDPPLSRAEITLAAGLFIFPHLLAPEGRKDELRPDETYPTFAGQVAKVHISPGRSAEALGAELLGPLDRAAQALALAPVPIFIEDHGDFDEDRIEPVRHAKRGIWVRVNAELVLADDLIAHILKGWVDENSLNRSGHEPRAWVRDGFAYYWPQWLAETGTVTPAFIPAARRQQLELRAAYAVSLGWQWHDLDRWHTARETFGEPMAGAVAWSVLETLAEAHGHGMVVGLVGQIAQPAPRGISALFAPYGDSGLARTTGWTGAPPSALEARWRQKLEDIQRRHQDALRQLPTLQAKVRTSSISPLAYQLEYQVTSTATTGLWVTTHLDLIDPLDGHFDPQRAFRRLTPVGPKWHRHPGTFPDRPIYLAFSVYLPELGCEVVVAAHRPRFP